MMLSLQKYNWSDFDINYIVSSKNADGVRLLELFLKDYKEEFNVQTVNPSCQKCLKGYLEQFKNKYKKMNTSKSNYKLKNKYQNIPLRYTGEGYNIMVNNDNLTVEYAEILLERYPKEKIFEAYPSDEETTETVEENTTITTEIETTNKEVVEAPKVKATRKKRK